MHLVINQGHLLPQAAVPPQLLQHNDFLMQKSEQSTPCLRQSLLNTLLVKERQSRIIS